MSNVHFVEEVFHKTEPCRYRFEKSKGLELNKLGFCPIQISSMKSLSSALFFGGESGKRLLDPSEACRLFFDWEGWASKKKASFECFCVFNALSTLPVTMERNSETISCSKAACEPSSSEALALSSAAAALL